MTDKDRRTSPPRAASHLSAARRLGRPRRRRYPQALRRNRHVHLRSRASPRPPAARARSPTSTATRASCSTAAIRSTSWPSNRPSWRSPTCCSTASCRSRRSSTSSPTPSRRHTMLHEQLATFYRGFRRDAHPMAIMCGVVGALSAFYHDSTDITDPQQRLIASHRLIAKMPTIAAMAYKYIDRPAVPLSRQRPQLHRQFPAHDLRRPGRAL